MWSFGPGPKQKTQGRIPYPPAAPAVSCTGAYRMRPYGGREIVSGAQHREPPYLLSIIFYLLSKTKEYPMAQQVFPTKSNLMATKRSLALATQGYDLMDRKRNILVREMMQLIDRAAGIQDRISAAYALSLIHISEPTRPY